MNAVAVGLDRAVEYLEKLEEFRKAVQSQNLSVVQHGFTVEVETGRKYDKVYINNGAQKLARYMVDRHTWCIFGTKSWAQVNERRFYGSLQTVDQWDWSGFTGVPKPGTAAEKEDIKRELEIAEGYRQRGRPRKKQ